MTTIKILAATCLVVVVAGCSAAPETSSRFQFSPAYAALPGTY